MSAQGQGVSQQGAELAATCATIFKHFGGLPATVQYLLLLSLLLVLEADTSSITRPVRYFSVQASALGGSRSTRCSQSCVSAPLLALCLSHSTLGCTAASAV